jgi:hypothetical protein
MFMDPKAASNPLQNGSRRASWIGVGRVAVSCLDGGKYESLRWRWRCEAMVVIKKSVLLVMIIVFCDCV